VSNPANTAVNRLSKAHSHRSEAELAMEADLSITVVNQETDDFLHLDDFSVTE